MSDRIEYPIEPAYPAFNIPASDDDLRTLGELCAIQGQIELLMQITVMVMSKTSLARARKHVSSSNISLNASVWLDVVEKNVSRANSKSLARAVVKEINIIRQGRNDFVHAFFAFGEGGDEFSIVLNIGTDSVDNSQKPAVAIHNFKANTMVNLKTIRDKVAAISQFIFHIYETECGIPQA